MATILRTGPVIGGCMVLLLGTAACGASEDAKRAARLATLLAERDSLLAQVAENARIMSEIGLELARVQTDPLAATGPSEGPPGLLTPDSILAGIRALADRILETESRLAESQRRIQALVADSTVRRAQIVDLEQMLESFRATIENQKWTIASLTARVGELERANARLEAEKAALARERMALAEHAAMLAEQNTYLTEAVAELTERENTAYYVIGTKEELIRRGIITEVGGSRTFLILGRRGQTLVPARDLDISQFTAIDRRYQTEIPLPDPERSYRIITRQDLSALAWPADPDGTVRGAIVIADPARFWANQKFLIVVQS